MNEKDEHYWELIAGNLHRELSPEENELFEIGLTDPLNQNYYSKSQKIRQGLSELKQVEKSDQTASWNAIIQQIRRNKIQVLSLRFLKYAAILLIAFLAVNYFDLLTKNETRKLQYAEMQVMFGQTGHLFLFDGTEVWLNSGSKLKYPNQFNQNQRNVFIEGEAYFKVTPNKKLPFKVQTGKLEIEVLGTSFNVSAYPGESSQSVVLVEGKVQINNPQGEKIGEIAPGQVAVKKEGDPVIKLQNIDPYSFTSWKDGKVIFDGERLGDIARKMERWYNVEIRFEKEKLKDFKFTGTILRNKPIDQTIMAMEMLAPIRFDYVVRTGEKNVITISQKKIR